MLMAGRSIPIWWRWWKQGDEWRRWNDNYSDKIMLIIIIMKIPCEHWQGSTQQCQHRFPENSLSYILILILILILFSFPFYQYFSDLAIFIIINIIVVWIWIILNYHNIREYCHDHPDKMYYNVSSISCHGILYFFSWYSVLFVTLEIYLQSQIELAVDSDVKRVNRKKIAFKASSFQRKQTTPRKNFKENIYKKEFLWYFFKTAAWRFGFSVQTSWD